MKTRDLNLARRPFVNVRPVRRLTILLWLFGAVLLAVNGWLYWQYFSHTDDSQQELESLRHRIEKHQEGISANKAAIARTDLLHQNAQVDFLNRKIAERAFPWSRLFDRLEEVLPNDVKLQSLAPNPEAVGRQEDQDVLPGGRVPMKIVGIARTVEAELDFVDRLFAHPSFERPRLQGDSTVKGGSLRFNLHVTYLPDRAPSRSAAEGPMEARQDGPPPAEKEAEDPEVVGETEVATAPASSAAGRGRLDQGSASRERTPPAPTKVEERAALPSRRASGTVSDVGEEEDPPVDPLDRARKNRRRSDTDGEETTPSQRLVSGSLVLPQNPSGGSGQADSGGNRRGTVPSSRTGSPRGRTTPGTDSPSSDDDGGEVPVDPRDPRRPSPRTPSASSTLEIQ